MARKKAKALAQPEPEMFTVYGDILQETEDAILVSCDGEEVWLPKSQIDYAGERGDEYVPITLPDWLAADKGLSDNQGFMPPQTADESLDAATDEVLAAAEPETVALKGKVLDINEDGLTFLVVYGDEDGTETEFEIPREQIVTLFDESTEVEENELVVTVAFAVEAGIIEDPDYREVDESPAMPEGATPEVLRKHPDLKWLAEEQRTISQKLTEAEKAEYADDMAKLDKEIEELEDERSRISNSLKKQIDAKENERRAMSKIVRQGQEEREILCDKVADYDSGEIKWADAVTGEVVDKRPMTSEERQLPLPIESMGGKKKGATPEQEAASDAPVEEGAEATDAPSDADDALYADGEASEHECHTCKHGDGDGATDCQECRDCDENTFSSWAQASDIPNDVIPEPAAESAVAEAV